MQGQSVSSLIIIAIVLAAVLWALVRLSQWVKSRGGLFVTIYEWEFGIRYVNGKFDAVLEPGRYVNWPLPDRHDIFSVRRTEQVELTPLIDVTSKDGLVFRMSAAIGYRIVDPREAHEVGHVERIRLAVSTALVRLASMHNLETLLSDRATIDASLKSQLGEKICGCELTSASVYSITLPPEVRRLFAEVERAKLEGQAALEWARGENAALRSLANAAGMLKGNPELMNLRILQTMSVPSGKNQLTLVLGKDGLLAGNPGEPA